MAEPLSRARLEQLLQQPVPPVTAERLVTGSPTLRCSFQPTTLDQVCRWQLAPAALRWSDGRLSVDPTAADRLRLEATCRRSRDGQPLFGSGPGLIPVDRLPAGLADRLLLASDQASGYQPRPVAVQPATDWDELAARWTGDAAQQVTAWLPQDPTAIAWVHPYSLAVLAAAEEAAVVSLPDGAEVRCEPLAWPIILAGSLRADRDPAAPPLLDPALARQLPYGAARALVELADQLSELGGPTQAARFLDDAAGSTVDPALPLAAADHRPTAE